MKTFADLKRRFVVGATLVMERNDWAIPERPNPLLNVPRKIDRVTSSGIQFEPHHVDASGSWLPYPPAKMIGIIDADRFSVQLSPSDPDKFMTYRFL